jgi:hypothetical protein
MAQTVLGELPHVGHNEVKGLKTTTKDKAAIVRIIQAKCKEASRTSFEFHQAYYSRISGRVATIPWDLVKFS